MNAMARVILHGGKRPTLCFNYRSPLNNLWDAAELKAHYERAIVDFARVPNGGLLLPPDTESQHTSAAAKSGLQADLEVRTQHQRGWRAPLPRRKSTKPPGNSCDREVTLPTSNCSRN
jgi:hypothetical protein